MMKGLIPDEYIFRLTNGHRLGGRVIDENGNPVSGATVQVMVEVDEPAWGRNLSRQSALG